MCNLCNPALNETTKMSGTPTPIFNGYVDTLKASQCSSGQAIQHKQEVLSKALLDELLLGLPSIRFPKVNYIPPDYSAHKKVIEQGHQMVTMQDTITHLRGDNSLLSMNLDRTQRVLKETQAIASQRWDAMAKLTDERNELERENNNINAENKLLGESLFEKAEQVRQMNLEHEDLMNAYKALMESQRLLIRSLE